MWKKKRIEKTKNNLRIMQIVCQMLRFVLLTEPGHKKTYTHIFRCELTWVPAASVFASCGCPNFISETHYNHNNNNNSKQRWQQISNRCEMKTLLCIDWSAVGFGFRLKGDQRGTKSQMLCGQWEIQIWKRIIDQILAGIRGMVWSKFRLVYVCDWEIWMGLVNIDF